MFSRPCVLNVLFSLCICCISGSVMAQPGEATAVPSPPVRQAAPDHGIVEFAGFTIPRLGDGFVLSCNELSTGVMYTVDVFRSNPADLHRVSDTTPFIRFSQSILPLSQIGTAEQLQAAVLADAWGMVSAIEGNTELGEPMPCTREILGQQRTGQRIAVVLSHDTEQDPEPLRGHIEVYAFEHDSKGLVVTLKGAESNVTAKADDAAHAAVMLERFTPKRIDRDTPYIYKPGGMPVRIPVGSRVVSAGQPDENSVNAVIRFDGGELSVFIARVPEGYGRDWIFQDLSTDYVSQMKSQVEQSNGQASILWLSDTAIPGPAGSRRPAEASTMLIETPNGPIYSLFYKDMVGDIIVTGTFNMDASDPERAHTLARIFADGFQGGGPVSLKSYNLTEHTITLSDDYWLTPLHDDNGEIDLMVINLSGNSNPDRVLQNSHNHRSVTVLQTLDPNDTRDLETLNAELLERIVLLGRESPEPDQPGGAAPSEASELEIRSAGGSLVRYLGRSATALPAASTEAAPASSPENTIFVHSRLLQHAPSGTRMHIASVSNPFMLKDSLAITEQIATELVPKERPGAHEFDFGILHYNSQRAFLASSQDGYMNEDERTWFMLDGDRIEITTSRPEERFEVLSARLLADSFIKLKWRSIALDEEQAVYPDDSHGLAEVNIAGHRALMFQAHLSGQDEQPTSRRSGSVRVRIYGFTHGDRYTTVAISQYNDFDDARLDKVAGMFQPKD